MTNVDEGLVSLAVLPSVKKIHLPLSRARLNFVANSDDIRSYYGLHQAAVKQDIKGLKNHMHVLNKAVYVLVASLWEAYCQDLAAEASEILVRDAKSWEDLPRSLVKLVAKELRSLNVEFAPWTLAGDGWRKYLTDRIDLVNRRKGFSFASPRSDAVDRLFLECIGLVKVSDRWAFDGVAPTVRRTQLDEHVEQRNRIVHEYKPGPVVHKSDIKRFFTLVHRLAWKTDEAVDGLLVQVTGQSHWIYPNLLAGQSSKDSGYAAKQAAVVRPRDPSAS